jgi:FMN phosphatase YigB (HAD superfamily)
MRIILDFDHTLFDTPRLKSAIQEIFRKHGVDEEVFLRTHDESRGEGRDWKPERQFAILKNLGIQTADIIREEFEKVMGESCVFLYKDTMPFLVKAKPNHDLALVTYGESQFQEKKLKGCPEMIKYFDKIVITQNLYKDKEVCDLSGGLAAVFVEDNPAALYAVKKYAPNVTTVRINRGAGRYADEVSGDGVDYEIKELSEVLDIIHENSFSN